MPAPVTDDTAKAGRTPGGACANRDLVASEARVAEGAVSDDGRLGRLADADAPEGVASTTQVGSVLAATTCRFLGTGRPAGEGDARV